MMLTYSQWIRIRPHLSPETAGVVYQKLREWEASYRRTRGEEPNLRSKVTLYLHNTAMEREVLSALWAI